LARIDRSYATHTGFACSASAYGNASYYMGSTNCWPVYGSPPPMSAISDQPYLVKQFPEGDATVDSTFSFCWVYWSDAAIDANSWYWSPSQYYVANYYSVTAPPGYSGSKSGVVLFWFNIY